jgi:stage II sporulation SpoE-like protein
LGSGVKANIFSTLTSKIAATMMLEGVGIDETVDTIVHTLPVCNVRKIAYSTFTIIYIHNDGKVYTAEYDNPPFFVIKKNRKSDIKKRTTTINGKKVLESNFQVQDGDTIVVTSDGVIHAGIGESLSMGWQWKNVDKYLNYAAKKELYSKDLCRNIINVCNFFYNSKPGDDTTIVAIKVKKKKTINIFTGPPKDKNLDECIVRRLMNCEGLKVVCGGTAATIVSRELNKKIYIDLNTMTKEIPPVASIEGVHLVTEGVLTLSYTLEKLKKYSIIHKKDNSGELSNDAASKLTQLLVGDCTHVVFLVGKAVNSAHQNPNLPFDLSIKLKIVEEIVDRLNQMGKMAEISYID